MARAPHTAQPTMGASPILGDFWGISRDFKGFRKLFFRNMGLCDSHPCLDTVFTTVSARSHEEMYVFYYTEIFWMFRCLPSFFSLLCFTHFLKSPHSCALVGVVASGRTADCGVSDAGPPEDSPSYGNSSAAHNPPRVCCGCGVSEGDFLGPDVPVPAAEDHQAPREEQKRKAHGT